MFGQNLVAIASVSAVTDDTDDELPDAKWDVIDGEEGWVVNTFDNHGTASRAVELAEAKTDEEFQILAQHADFEHEEPRTDTTTQGRRYIEAARVSAEEGPFYGATYEKRASVAVLALFYVAILALASWFEGREAAKKFGLVLAPAFARDLWNIKKENQ